MHTVTVQLIYLPRCHSGIPKPDVLRAMHDPSVVYAHSCMFKSPVPTGQSDTLTGSH